MKEHPILLIIGVRVERLQDISYQDAVAEGMLTLPDQDMQDAARAATYRGQKQCDAVDYFRWFWNTLNTSRGHAWEKNPWVWAITFKILEKA